MRTILLFGIILLLQGCAPKHVLNKQVIQENQLTKNILDRVQFYNTKDIVLTRYEEGTKENTTEKGKVTVSLGQEIEQIVIRAETKGRVIKHLEGGRIAISFEPSNSNYLVFGPSQIEPHTYVLQATKWKYDRGLVQYGEHSYYTNQGSADCKLAFKLKKNYQQQRNTRIVKGNKV